MAAGFVTKVVSDGNGGTFSARFWCPDTSASPQLLFPGGLVVDQNAAPLDYTADTPVKNGATAFVTTANSMSSPVLTPTYMSSHIGLVPAASCTDLWGLVGGSSNKNIRLISLIVTATATAAQILPISLVKRSTLDTTGTLVTTVVPTAVDTAYSAATAAVRGYSANPGALGTPVQTAPPITKRLTVGKADGTGLAPTHLEMVPQAPGAGYLTIYNATDMLALNLNATTVTGGLFDISAVWTEL